MRAGLGAQEVVERRPALGVGLVLDDPRQLVGPGRVSARRQPVGIALGRAAAGEGEERRERGRGPRRAAQKAHGTPLSSMISRRRSRETSPGREQVCRSSAPALGRLDTGLRSVRPRGSSPGPGG